MKKPLLLILGAVLVMGATDEQAVLKPEETTKFNGREAMPFIIRGHNGVELSLATFRGKPVLVTFFATWSPTCRNQLQELAALHSKYADSGLRIIALAVDGFENPETVKDIGPMAVEMKLPFPVAGANKEVADGYFYKGFPATFIIDGQGKITRTFLGIHKSAEFESILRPLIVRE